MPVQRASASEQIANELREQIESGDLAPGEVLPSDAELAVRFDVSKPTITKARAMLVALGLVASRAGAASTVRDVVPERPGAGQGRPARWTGRTYPEGHGARVVSARIAPAAPAVAAAIGTEAGAPVIERREVTYAADGRPLAVSTACFPAILIDQCPALLATEPIAEGATRYVERQTGRAAATVAADVSCRPSRSEGDGEAAGLGTYVLALTTTIYDANDVAIAHEVELHPPGTPIAVDVSGSLTTGMSR
jgi:DNA-binding GntR family transcriptional regulator